MKILGYSLKLWVLHPILVWQSYSLRNVPVVDLDNLENNCPFCGHDHHHKERIK